LLFFSFFQYNRNWVIGIGSKAYRDILKAPFIEIGGKKWPTEELIAAAGNANKTTGSKMKIFYTRNIAGWRPADSAVVLLEM